MASRKRYTIGVLLPTTGWWYSNHISEGIIAGAKEAGFDLRFITGSFAGSPQAREHMKNRIYKLVTHNSVDGIISLTGFLCTHFSNDEQKLENFFAPFAPMPIVSIGIEIKSHCSILMDNKAAIKRMVGHLYEEHGCRNLVYVSGPANNGEARERLEGFKQGLAAWGLPYDPVNVIYGNFVWKDGLMITTELFDRRKLKPDGVICANDDMAHGMLEHLGSRGITVPEDMALTGYDDRPESATSFPPLTTVKQPLYEQGAEAARRIYQWLETGSTRMLCYLEGIPRYRESCGCHGKDGKKFKEGSLLSGRLNPPGKEQDGLAWVFENARISDKKQEKLITRLYNALAEDVTRGPAGEMVPVGEKGPGEEHRDSRFFSVLRPIIYEANITDHKLADWHRILGCIFGYASHKFTGQKEARLLTEQEKLTLKLLDKVKNILEQNKNIRSDSIFWRVRGLMEGLGSSYALEELLETIYRVFPLHSINTFYLFIYDGETLGCSPEELAYRKLQMVFGSPEGEVIRYRQGPLYPADLVLSGKIPGFPEHKTFLAYMICANYTYYGIILFEYDMEILQYYEMICDRLCSLFDTIRNFTTIEQVVKERTVELENANEQLKELDKAKTHFFANISHELRTPLTLILSPLESLLAGDYGKQVLQDASINTVFTAMHTNSVQLMRLINNLLDFSKISAGRMLLSRHWININTLLQYFITSIHSGITSKGLSLEYIRHAEQIVLSLDHNLIEKAFFNLLSNAMKFSRPGGRITVELTREENEVLIIVKDEGIGIPPDKIETVFERFTQVEQSTARKYEGTGIGLAFTKEIIELHKGRISVESRLGEGSVFTIRLPYEEGHTQEILPDRDGCYDSNSWLTAEFEGEKSAGEWVSEKTGDKAGEKVKGTAKEEAETKIKEEALERANQNGNPGSIVESEKDSTILLVDDNRSMRDFVSGLLEKKYSVYTSTNGKEALELIKKGVPDLIISDVMMPEMDGLELCRVLKENKKTASIPLILLTARMDMTTRIKGLEQQADDFLLKPFNARELFARIGNLLIKRRLELNLQATTAALWGEMKTARKIQSSLLPVNPKIPGYTMSCYIKSADEVSGDYYDIIHAGDKSWLVIGDVSGHGITAGLVMMMVQTAINLLIQTSPGLTPARLLSSINVTIKNNISKLGLEKFMTITVFALLDNGRVLFSGLHQDIYIYRTKSACVEVLESKGMWIGFIDDISDQVQNDSFELTKGDTLLLYTDGITEAVKKESTKETIKETNRERFGNKRLLDILKNNGDKTAGEIKERLIRELEEYNCNDDFTFVILKRI